MSRQSVFEYGDQIHARRSDHGALLLFQDLVEDPAFQFGIERDSGAQPAGGREPGGVGARLAPGRGRRPGRGKRLLRRPRLLVVPCPAVPHRGRWFGC